MNCPSKKRQELTPIFLDHSYCYFQGNRAYVLKTHTYCMCCDRFLDEVKYAIKLDNGEVHHRIPESSLSFEPETNE